MNRRAILVALIVSLVFSVILWKKVQEQAKPTVIPQVAEPPKIPTTQAVVAKQKIPARLMLEAAQLNEYFELKELIASAVPADAFTSIASLTKKYTSITILPGDIMTPSRILDKDVIPALSFAVPQGKRAVTIAVSKTSGVGGFIQQGDFVDVIASFKQGTPDSIAKIVLQDILVLAAGNTYAFDPGIATAAPAIAAAKMELVTLAVTPEELERIVFLDSSVSFRLVLKNPKDKGEQVITKGATEKMVMRTLGFTEPVAVQTVPTTVPEIAPKSASPAAPQAIETIETGRVEIMYGTQRHFEMNKFGVVQTSPYVQPLPPMNPPPAPVLEAPAGSIPAPESAPQSQVNE